MEPVEPPIFGKPPFSAKNSPKTRRPLACAAQLVASRGGGASSRLRQSLSFLVWWAGWILIRRHLHHCELSIARHAAEAAANEENSSGSALQRGSRSSILFVDNRLSFCYWSIVLVVVVLVVLVSERNNGT